MGPYPGGKPCQDIFKSIHGLNGSSLFTLYSDVLTHPPLEKENPPPLFSCHSDWPAFCFPAIFTGNSRISLFSGLYIVPCYFSLFPLIQMLLTYKVSPNNSYFVTLLNIFASTPSLNVGHRCVILLPVWGLGRSESIFLPLPLYF